MIGLGAASRLLDFSGSVPDDVARGQLEGAVAVHNILEREGVAYLADEVGMGKTLVALGVLALYRHWNPAFRAMIIAPRENIQRKWKKEFERFARCNVRVRDLRVRALHDAPARALVHCSDLLHLARETTLDPDRDFVLRMTSFSLPFGSDEGRRKKRDAFLHAVPWLKEELLDLRSREGFTQNVARALCCILPPLDLLIVDEAHNLKHGFPGGSTRNLVLATMFGRDEDVPSRTFPGYGLRARRVLLLSATPVETDYRELWNQLDVFGRGAAFEALRSPDAAPQEKRECARRILVRRIASMTVGGERLTKNRYRREWRGGGVEKHDEQLEVPDHMRRLIVALVQKKVSEALQSPRFNNCFQIGMLASFESFLETVRLRSTDGDKATTFDQTDQTTDELEREGVDVAAVNRIARDYRRHFGGELPHPKMDAVVDGLARGLETGEKALVFVRRVASVRELKRKLDERYDRYLLARLRRELAPQIVPELDRLYEQYHDERRREIEREERRGAGVAGGPADDHSLDAGGKDTFFAWFFRGEGPPDAFSGAVLQRRFGQASAALSTVFDDNWVAWLLGVSPGEVPEVLARRTGLSWEELDARMRESVAGWLGPGRAAERRNYFLGFQRATLEVLAGLGEASAAGGAGGAASTGSTPDDDLARRARTILDLRFHEAARGSRSAAQVPAAEAWLRTRTLFTEIRERPELADELLIDNPGSSNAALSSTDEARRFAEAFRTREMRRELVSALCRLGHPAIDLFVLVANRLGSLRAGARATSKDDIGLIEQFCDLLAIQRRDPGGFHAFREIRQALEHFDLVVDLNAPDARGLPLPELADRFARLLRGQQPIGGMAGKVNETLVRQFRMPGYPLVLITTDLLQEGEDLHPFCSAVYHYGISWMPSSMEQRIGRIDRVNSATQRRLTRLERRPDGDELLQVYYPHLKETVEVLQVDRVLERMAEFIRLMHEDLITEEREEKRIDISNEILRRRRVSPPPDIPLETAFPAKPELLRGVDRPLAVDERAAEEILRRFARVPELLRDLDVEWRERSQPGLLLGVLQIEERGRRQPFTLFLRSIAGRALVRCVSPVGKVPPQNREELLAEWETRTPLARLAVVNGEAASYNLTVEGDVLLGPPEADAERLRHLIHAVAGEADELEAEALDGTDADPSGMLSSLGAEVGHER